MHDGVHGGVCVGANVSVRPMPYTAGATGAIAVPTCVAVKKVPSWSIITKKAAIVWFSCRMVLPPSRDSNVFHVPPGGRGGVRKEYNRE